MRMTRRRLLVLSGLCILAITAVAGLWHLRTPDLPARARAGYVHDPPYMYDGPDGRPRGVSVDVLQEAARRSGIRIEWVRVLPPHDADSALHDGQVDLWPGLTILPERQQALFFSDPWLRLDLWLVVRDQGRLPSADFRGRIGMTPHPVNHILIRRHYPAATRRDYSDTATLTAALCAGEVDAGLLSAVDLARVQGESAAACRAAGLRPYTIEGSQLRLGVAARPGFAATAARLRAAIDGMAADRTLGDLVVPHSVYAASHVQAVYELLHARDRARYLGYGAVALSIVLALTLTLSAAVYRADQRAKRSLREKVALEERLHAAQRLEVLGQLAGGIAHDFNNLATIIVGYSALVQGEAAASPRLAEAVREIRRAGERAADLVRQLLTFSKRQAMEPRVVSVHQQLREMQPMLRRVVREDIALVLDLAATADRLLIDEGQLSRVVLNLVINAADAMPGGGSITLATGNEAAPGAADLLRLSVHDTGSGMSPEVQAHVFEPFFTTKGPGHGTGLGLSTVHGVVTQCGGTIEVWSQPGQGSRFDLRFPVAHAVPTPAASEPATTTEVPGAWQTILVVEDKTEVRELVLSVLRSAAFRVIEAADGEQGLERLRGADERIALVLTDLVMPRLSGQRFLQQARAAGSRVPFLFMSGYSEEAVVPPEAGGGLLLAKPFTPEQLLGAVSRALASAPGPFLPPAAINAATVDVRSA